VLSLWKGMAAPLVFCSLQTAILYQSYSAVLRLQASASGDVHQIPSVGQGFVAGCVAGFAQVWIWSPVEMVKVRMQLMKSAAPGVPGAVPIGPLALVGQIYKQNGIPGLYRGITVTALRDVLGFGVFFAAYHALIRQIEGPDVHPEAAGPMTHLFAGGTAGALSWVGIYGLDVIKTRMQATSKLEQPGTWLQIGTKLWRQEGSRVFVRGMAPTLARGFALDGISFLSFTATLKVLNS